MAQQQLQQDEEEEERQQWIEQREMLLRQRWLENITNNTSGQQLNNYQRQEQNNSPPPSPLPLSPPHSRPPSPVPQLPRIQNNLPKGRAPYQEPTGRHSLRPMILQCPYCQALHFNDEKLSRSTLNEPRFGMCCLTGQIQLPAFPAAPQDLRNLFDGTDIHSLEFKTNIWQYNATFAFTSLGVKVDHTVTAGSGSYSFRISGGLHHLSGALLPLPNQAPVFAQLYIYDPLEQQAHRQQNNQNLNPAVVAIIQGVLNQSHPYIALYKQAYQVMREKPAEEQQTVAIWL